MIESVVTALKTGVIPDSDKLPVALMINFMFSIMIFIVSSIITSFWAEKNILGLKEYKFFWNIFKWSIGSVIVCAMLLISDMITYKIFSLLMVAFSWDSLFIKLQKNISKERQDIPDNL